MADVTDQVAEVDSTQSATPQTTTNDSPTTQDYSNDQDSGATTSPAPSEVSEDTSREEKQAVGKLQEVQRELRAKEEQLSQVLNYIASDEDVYEKALVRMKGMSKDEAKKQIANLKAQNPSLWKEAQKAQAQAETTGFDPSLINQAINQHPAVQHAMRLAQEEAVKQEQLLTDFEAKHPNILNEEKPEIVRGIIAARARDFMEYNRLKGVNVNLEQALEHGYSSLYGSGEQLEQAKLDGMLKGASGSVGTKPISSGQIQSKTSTKDYSSLKTPVRENARLSAGMSEEEYYSNF